MGEAITRAILAKAKVYPKLYDQPLADFFSSSGTTGTVLTLGFKTVGTAGTDILATYTIVDVQTLTFKTLAQAVTTKIVDRAEQIDVTGQRYYYLDSFILSNSNAGDRLAYDLNMADATLTIMAKSKVKLQNVTTNNAGGRC